MVRMGRAGCGKVWDRDAGAMCPHLCTALRRPIFPGYGTGQEDTERGECSPLRRGKPATEQNSVGHIVPNEEKEGVVGAERGARIHAALHNQDG